MFDMCHYAIITACQGFPSDVSLALHVRDKADLCQLPTNVLSLLHLFIGETLLKFLTVRTLYNTGSHYALRAVRRTQLVFSSKKYSWATFSNSSISSFFPKKNILLDFSNISWIAIWSGLLLQQEFWPISTPKHYPLCIHQDVPDEFVI